MKKWPHWKIKVSVVSLGSSAITTASDGEEQIQRPKAPLVAWGVCELSAVREHTYKHHTTHRHATTHLVCNRHINHVQYTHPMCNTHIPQAYLLLAPSSPSDC